MFFVFYEIYLNLSKTCYSVQGFKEGVYKTK